MKLEIIKCTRGIFQRLTGTKVFTFGRRPTLSVTDGRGN